MQPRPPREVRIVSCLFFMCFLSRRPPCNVTVTFFLCLSSPTPILFRPSCNITAIFLLHGSIAPAVTNTDFRCRSFSMDLICLFSSRLTSGQDKNKNGSVDAGELTNLHSTTKERLTLEEARKIVQVCATSHHHR